MAPCALLKAALLCSGAVGIEGHSGTLEEQLRDRVGGGLEIEVRFTPPLTQRMLACLI